MSEKEIDISLNPNASFKSGDIEGGIKFQCVLIPIATWK
jgi:hypothetical protein